MIVINIINKCGRPFHLTVYSIEFDDLEMKKPINKRNIFTQLSDSFIKYHM